MHVTDDTELFWLPDPSGDWRERLQAAISEDPSGRLLRGLCSTRLSTAQLRKVRTEINAAQADGASFQALQHVRLGLIGAGTLDFLAELIPGTAPRFGMKIDVAPVHYNSIGMPPFGTMGLEGPLDVVAIVPDTQGFARPASLVDRDAHEQSVAEALAGLNQIVATMRQSFGCGIVLATIPADIHGATGSADRAIQGSLRRFIADLNAGIVDLAAEQGLALWDLEAVAAEVGLRNWRDPVSMHVAKSPFSIRLAPLVADRLCAVIAPLAGKSRRALVLDLDNTLWEGVIGDDGLEGINIGQGDAVGEAFLAVQRYALELRRRGIVLCVCSKNNDDVAREPFRRHPDMLLREDHIAVFQANWSDKATNLKAIADELSLNVDALVFLDDNPAERARVRQRFPEIAVPELPEDPAFYVTCLAAAGYFEASSVSADDINRAEAYQANAKRAQIRQVAGNYDEYLQSLGMTLVVGDFDSMNRSRVTQLINKSNQFNLTTVRRQEPAVEAIEESPDHVGLQFRLLDTFGDNGLICVVVLERQGDSFLIDTWLMSCRVLERGVEKAVLNQIVERVRSLGGRTLVGTYIPTERNSMVRNHYANLGFSPRSADAEGEGVTQWELDVARFEPATVYMEIQLTIGTCEPAGAGA